MTIERLQLIYSHKSKPNKRAWGKDARTLHLGEEVGEFMEIVMRYKGYKKPKKNKADIAVALADILDDIFALAKLYNINFVDLIKYLLKV